MNGTLAIGAGRYEPVIANAYTPSTWSWDSVNDVLDSTFLVRRRSALSALICDTDADHFRFVCWGSWAGAASANLAVWCDGVYVGEITPPSGSTYCVGDISLPGTGVRRVEIRDGTVARSNPLTVFNYVPLVQIMKPSWSQAYVVPPSAPEWRIMSLGDSIEAGNLLDVPARDSAAGILRASFPSTTRLTTNAWGNRKIQQDYIDGGNSMLPLAALSRLYLDGSTKNTFIIEEAVNDCTTGTVPVSTWGGYVDQLIDALLAGPAIPGLTIHWQTAYLAPSVDGNVYHDGVTLEDYRQEAIARVVARADSRVLWQDGKNGPGLIPGVDFIDGLHPNVAGNVKIAAWRSAWLGL